MKLGLSIMRKHPQEYPAGGFKYLQFLWKMAEIYSENKELDSPHLVRLETLLQSEIASITSVENSLQAQYCFSQISRCFDCSDTVL